MSYNFKLPSITGKTPDEKLQQLQSYLFKLVADLNYFAGMKGDETAPSVQTAVSDTALSTFQQKLNALQNAIASIRQEIENQPELPAEIEFLEGVTSNLQSQLDDKPNTTDLAKVATSGSYDDLNDKPTIPSLDDVNANINRLLGTVLYEVNPTNGIYCNGKTTVDSVNSATLVDPERVYKRLKIYARFPRGLTCVEFPLDITLKGPDAVFANNNRQGAISFPTGDNVSGATRYFEALPPLLMFPPCWLSNNIFRERNS